MQTFPGYSLFQFFVNEQINKSEINDPYPSSNLYQECIF
jgi:hypothetical protein